MPNWVQNEIRFDDNVSEEILQVMRRELASGDGSEQDDDDRLLDFNKLIPMPEALNVNAGAEDNSIAYYITERLTIPAEQTNLNELIHNSFSDDWVTEVVSRLKNYTANLTDEQCDSLYERGKQYMYNREHYGHYHWYSWCCYNWGTKWNASNTYWEGRCLSFQTAWSAPHPVIEALAKRYNVSFTHRWADEDIGNNCGELWYDDKGNHTEEYVGDTDEDYRRFALGVWGYDENEFEDEDKFDDDDNECEECETDTYDEDPEIEDNGLSWEDVIGITS